MTNAERKVVLHPVINSMQKLVVYELRDWFYVVGSNNTESSFRVLRINRTRPKDLVILDDNQAYSNWSEVQALIAKVDHKASKGVAKSVCAFGLVGFVRFMEGYYMILVTKRRPVATIGLHHVYKIEDTTMIYIPNEAVKFTHHDESRYLKMFQSVDLSSNFYFSYSYDITHSLQVNLAVPTSVKQTLATLKRNSPRRKDGLEFAIRSSPNRKFVWNDFLNSGIEGRLYPDWILHITHGFIGQSVISIFGRSILVTLIARRSNKFAGTRFLKRGANFDGDVANEVETEQIVEDMGVSSWPVFPRISSFVQIRGSIPGHWSQEGTKVTKMKIVAKPAITYHLADPFAQTPGRHFKNLMDRYGSPIIVLNLVKQREKKKHESTLSDQYLSDIKYLNQFLPPQHHIQYVSFDMARKNKGNKAVVMDRLAKIAETAIGKTSVYLRCNDSEQLQTGVIRVNCVDCLDRTHSAQFALGKYALAVQLSKLGLFSEGQQLDFDCDTTCLLELLYEHHGDTLALQYGGSQLVHRIKTYRKTAPWTSQGNDIMQTISRYYSNTFSDAEKQDAINLFLGLFVPAENDTPIWEQTTDFYIHNPSTIQSPWHECGRLPITQWWGKLPVDSLPMAVRRRQASSSLLKSLPSHSLDVDAYKDFHRPGEYTHFSDLIFTISHTIRDFAPPSAVDLSPFTVRSGRRDDKANPRNNGAYSSSTSGGNTSSDSSWLDSEEEEIKTECSSPARQSSGAGDNSLPSKEKHVVLRGPSPQDVILYRRYVAIQKQAMTSRGNYIPLANLLSKPSKFKQDSSYQIDPPRISEDSLKIYQNYVQKRYNTLEGCISSQQVEKYARYRNNELFVYSARQA